MRRSLLALLVALLTSGCGSEDAPPSWYYRVVPDAAPDQAAPDADTPETLDEAGSSDGGGGAGGQASAGERDAS